MKKNEDRMQAEQTYLDDRGRITNKELAKRLGVHPATVARWKKLDEWDLKLVQSVTDSDDAAAIVDDMFRVDMRHIALLNERIDSYLHKKELLATEILELSQAKFHIISCMEIINDQVRYPAFHPVVDEESDFD